MKHALRIPTLLAVACAAVGLGNAAQAVEGGSGVYALGYISPQAGLMPEAGTYGSYNDYGYRGTSTSAVSASGQIPVKGTHLKLPAQLNGSLTTHVDSTSSLLSLTHVFAEKVLGGQAGLAVLLPYADANLDLKGSGVLSLTGPSGHVHNLPLSGKEDVSNRGIDRQW